MSSCLTALGQAVDELVQHILDFEETFRKESNAAKSFEFKRETLESKIDMFCISQYQQFIGTGAIIDYLHDVKTLFSCSKTMGVIHVVKQTHLSNPTSAMSSIRTKTGCNVPVARLIFELVIEMTRHAEPRGVPLVR